jgi:hypothetical protein
MGPSRIRLRRRRQARRSPSQFQVHSTVQSSKRALLVPPPSILALSSAPLPAVVCVSMLRRRAAFEPNVATFEQAVECAGAQGIMNHAQPYQQSDPSLRTMRGSQAPRCAVTPAVAIPPLRCHAYNRAADGGCSRRCIINQARSLPPAISPSHPCISHYRARSLLSTVQAPSPSSSLAICVVDAPSRQALYRTSRENVRSAVALSGL